MGYLVKIAGVHERADVSLLDYTRPYLFLGFVQFLIKRGVSRCHILKHISVAKKLNSYLGAGKKSARI